MIIGHKRSAEASFEEALVYARQVMQRVNTNLNNLSDRVNNVSNAINQKSSSESQKVARPIATKQNSSISFNNFFCLNIFLSSQEFKELFAKKDSLRFTETERSGYFVWGVTETYPEFYTEFNKIVHSRNRFNNFLLGVNESISPFKKCMVHTVNLRNVSDYSLLACDLKRYHGNEKIPLNAELKVSQVLKGKCGESYTVPDPLLTAFAKALILGAIDNVCSELDFIFSGYEDFRPLSLTIKLDGQEYTYHYLNLYTLLRLIGNDIKVSSLFSTLTEGKILPDAFLVLPSGEKIRKPFFLVSSNPSDHLTQVSLEQLSIPKEGRLVTRDGWLKNQRRISDQLAADLADLKIVFLEYLSRPTEELRQLLATTVVRLRAKKPAKSLKWLTDYLDIVNAFATPAKYNYNGQVFDFISNEYPTAQPFFNFVLSPFNQYFSRKIFKDFLVFLTIPKSSMLYSENWSAATILEFDFCWKGINENTQIKGHLSFSKALEKGSLRGMKTKIVKSPILAPPPQLTAKNPEIIEVSLSIPDPTASAVTCPVSEIPLDEIPLESIFRDNEILTEFPEDFLPLSPLGVLPDSGIIQPSTEPLELKITAEEFVGSELKCFSSVIQSSELNLFLSENTTLLRLIRDYMDYEQEGALVRKRFVNNPPREMRVIIEQDEPNQYTLDIDSNLDLSPFFEPRVKANYSLKSCDSYEKGMSLLLEIKTE